MHNYAGNMSKLIKEVSIRKMRWLIFLLGLTKIPLIGFVRPKLLLLTDDEVALKIKLRRRSRNHLNSMYFGALAIGADVAAGVHAFYFAEKMGKKVSFAFKGINGEFIKRAESDVIFRTDQGQLVKEAMDKSLANNERVNETITISAVNSDNEVVATFDMIISVRVN